MNAIHLCIATGQNAANFIPLKQLCAREVWILETPEMSTQRSAKALSTALKSLATPPQVHVVPFDDSTPRTMQEAAFQLAAEKLDGRDVIFHVTGGTKLMVLAIHQQLANLETGSGSYRLLYADTQRRTLDWLGSESKEEPMADVLLLNELLQVRGYRTLSDIRPGKDERRAAARTDMTRFMGDNATALRGFLGALNFHANAAAESGGLMRQFDYLPWGAGEKLLAKAQSLELLTVNHGLSTVTFGSQEIAEYFSGGWVEEYVFMKLAGISKPDQYAMNVRISHNLTNTQNEIDAILVNHNRSLIIECKSGKQDDTQASIYKLGQIVRQVGGLMSHGLYVSALAISEADRARAREYGVDVLAAGELTSVSDYLRSWSKGP